MTESGNGERTKPQVLKIFEALAPKYDQLRFLQVCANRLVEIAVDRGALLPGARVLDVATGTGWVTLVAARMVGPTGRVVGVDLSPDMLERAHQKLASLDEDMPQVQFRQGDAGHLDVPDQTFDLVLCASSLFFIPDMLGALREWYRVLVPGGWMGFSSFGPTFLKPVSNLWAARLQQQGNSMPPGPNERLVDPDVCVRLLGEAGFEQVKLRTEQLGYYQTADECWNEIAASLYGVTLRELTPTQREQIKAAYMSDLQGVATEKGIWIDVPDHIAWGIKP